MGFSKRLLASLIAIASSGAIAMEALDEQSLSDTTGQAGMNITITPPAGGLAFSMLYHDTDGIPVAQVPGSTYTSAGAILVGNVPGTTGYNRFSLSNTSGWLFKVDSGAQGTTNALINVNLTSLGSTTLHTGDIRIGVSNAGTGLLAGGTLTNVIIQDTVITFGAGNLFNMQLGNEQQGSMMRLNASYPGGLTITNLNVVDAAGSATAGGIKVGTVTIKDCGSASCATVGTNLATDLGLDANASGLQLGFNSLGNTANSGAHIMLANITVGSLSGTTYLGDIEINGFNPANTTLQISAH